MSKTIGLIGCGRWGKNILRDLCALESKVWVVDPSLAIQAEVLNKGALAAYSAISDIFKQVDGFIVATPTVTHADTIEKLLPFNKPIFVEKPLTCHIPSAHRLARLTKNNIFVMDKWRYHPGIATLAEQIRIGALGSLQAIRTCRLGWGHFHTDVDPIWILLPHDLSIVLHLLGQLPPIKLVTSLTPANPAAGVLIILEGFNTPKVIIEMSTLHTSHCRSVLVIGDKGSLQLRDAYDDHVLFCKQGQHNADEKMMIDSTPPLFLELKAFIHYLQGGPAPKSSLKEGIEIVEKISEIKYRMGVKDQMGAWYSF